MDCLEVYFDGAREPDGVGTYGLVVTREGKELYGEGGIACAKEPYCTNNYTEYIALVKALEKALELEASCVYIYGDSQLVVRQIAGLYKVKAPHLKPLYDKAIELLQNFQHYEVTWVPREKNRADRYTKEAYRRLAKFSR
ncbi:MAG: reverse transcriptase-like protein [Pyrobaculum sp.]